MPRQRLFGLPRYVPRMKCPTYLEKSPFQESVFEEALRGRSFYPHVNGPVPISVPVDLRAGLVCLKGRP